MSTYRPGSRVPVTGTYMCLSCATQLELTRSNSFRTCGKGCLFPRYVLLESRERPRIEPPPGQGGEGRGNPSHL